MKLTMLDNTSEMAASLFSDLLAKGSIRLGVHGMAHINLLQVKEFQIAKSDFEGANVEIDLEYTKLDMMGMENNSPTPSLTNSMSLLFLSPFGDSEWDEAFRNRLFKGNPPISVALDVRNKHLYLVFVEKDSMQLTLFCELTEEEVEVIVDTLSYKKPFTLHLENRVLMKIITGEEGYNYARQLIQIRLNTTMQHSYYSLIVQSNTHDML